MQIKTTSCKFERCNYAGDQGLEQKNFSQLVVSSVWYGVSTISQKWYSIMDRVFIKYLRVKWVHCSDGSKFSMPVSISICTSAKQSVYTFVRELLGSVAWFLRQEVVLGSRDGKFIPPGSHSEPALGNWESSLWLILILINGMNIQTERRLRCLSFQNSLTHICWWLVQAPSFWASHEFVQFLIWFGRSTMKKKTYMWMLWRKRKA